MTTAFTDFLREKSKKLGTETMASHAVIDEWREAVARLFAQMRDWLKASDPEGIIEIKAATRIFWSQVSALTGFLVWISWPLASGLESFRKCEIPWGRSSHRGLPRRNGPTAVSI